jgi:predicted dehydrogenase
LHHKQINFDGDQPVPIYGKGEIISFPAGEPLLKECEAFLAAIAARKPPITDGASGLRVLEVLEAAQASLDGGGAPVSLP